MPKQVRNGYVFSKEPFTSSGLEIEENSGKKYIVISNLQKLIFFREGGASMGKYNSVCGM